MNEEMLRAMIRESVAKHLGTVRQPDCRSVEPLPFLTHASHYRYQLPPSGGPCLIEPVVSCSHCGYCESHGH